MIDDPKLAAALAQNQAPGARSAALIAQRMSLEQAGVISRSGGIHMIDANKGCMHCCLGCMVKHENQFSKISWAEFQDRVDGLVNLESTISQVYGLSDFHLLSRHHYLPFFDSDPMSALFPSEAGPKTIRDMMIYLHKRTKTPFTLVTSGWNPRNQSLQDAATLIAEDLRTGKAHYLRKQFNAGQALYFQVKIPAKPLRTHIEREMIKRLREDPHFLREFGAHLDRYALDFSKYPDPGKVLRAYEGIAYRNLETVLRSSPYFNDRVDNLATLLPATAKKTLFLNLYTSRNETFAEAYLRPFMDGPVDKLLMQMLKEKGLNGEKIHVGLRPWLFHPDASLRPKRGTLGTPILSVDGRVMFSGAPVGELSNNIPDLARSQLPEVRAFVDNPMIAISESSPPPRLMAAARVQQGSIAPLSENAIESIFNRVAEWLEGTGELPTVQTVSVDKVVRRVSDADNKTRSVVKIDIDGREFHYHFGDDQVHPIPQAKGSVTARKAQVALDAEMERVSTESLLRHELPPASSLRRANRRLVKLLDDSAPSLGAGDQRGLSFEGATKIHNRLQDNPVTAVTPSHLDFSFGRAMAAHISAMKLGLPDASVIKLFVQGTLSPRPELKWRFHMVTLVRAQEGGWWVIDPLLGLPRKLKDWLAHFKEIDAGSAQLSVSHGDRLDFLPANYADGVPAYAAEKGEDGRYGALLEKVQREF